MHDDRLSLSTPIKSFYFMLFIYKRESERHRVYWSHSAIIRQINKLNTTNTKPEKKREIFEERRIIDVELGELEWLKLYIIWWIYNRLTCSYLIWYSRQEPHSFSATTAEIVFFTSTKCMYLRSYHWEWVENFILNSSHTEYTKNAVILKIK